MFAPAKCPNCAGSLQVPTDRHSIICMYCGIDIIVKQLLANDDGTVRLENLLELARTSEKGRNFPDTHKYFSEAILVDAQCLEAWLGRANAVARMSKIAGPRIHEAIEDINYAMKLGISPEIAASFANKFYETCASVFLGFSRYLTNDRTNEDLKMPQIWETYGIGAFWCCQGFDKALELKPTDPDAIDNIISATSSIVKLAKHARNHLQNIPNSEKAMENMVAAMTSAFATFTRLTIDKKLADPSYKVPTLEVKSQTKSGCLVPIIFILGAGAALHALL